jgi:hypothetical protein
MLFFPRPILQHSDEYRWQHRFDVGQHHKLVPISEVAAVQDPSVFIFPRQYTQPSFSAPIPNSVVPSNANVPTPPLSTNKLIARIPKLQPNRPGTSILPTSASIAAPPLMDCWKKQLFSKVMRMMLLEAMLRVRILTR